MGFVGYWWYVVDFHLFSSYWWATVVINIVIVIVCVCDVIVFVMTKPVVLHYAWVYLLKINIIFNTITIIIVSL